ncbi:hypothetical protein BT63DRAFT_423418 [Microthyrium microscopicum]|uniref:Uncharacterized protein n=1 Tax=Microthyrium microscopicum TaxID=703497 RepID=A0A6A6UFZ8_9PEZI|nr:hypothetical protein BT63DRAFT_423418 [Microthyrium microscopicum]
MKLTLTIVTALIAMGALADKHKYCACDVDGKHNEKLSHDTCTRWGQTLPNTEWRGDKHACHDYKSGGGIDGLPWENTCKKVYQDQGRNPGAVRGKCHS